MQIYIVYLYICISIFVYLYLYIFKCNSSQAIDLQGTKDLFVFLKFNGLKIMKHKYVLQEIDTIIIISFHLQFALIYEGHNT